MRNYSINTLQWNPATIGFAIASIILAYDPTLWLVNSWRDPSYQSTGMIYALLVLCLLVWSISSEKREQSHQAQYNALLLLAVSSLIRLASQLMAINILGGIALALDVFAIACLLGLSSRTRPVSPFWISTLFLFSLPFERIAQRILGYPMQEISAFGSCQILDTFFDDLVCNGIRLQVQGQDVLVDLPCSGTQSLMLCTAVYVTLNALYRPRFLQAVYWGIATIVLAIIGNAIRISILAAGIVHQEFTGINVMEQPMHDVIGYATIALPLIPLFWFYKPNETRKNQHIFQAIQFSFPKLKKWQVNLASIGFVALAVAIISLPRQALDVSRKIPVQELPQVLSNSSKQTLELEAIEKSYFSQYGGTAQKAVYGPMAITLVQTTSPLRHLHSPDDCLRGLGYKVTFVGSQFEPTPSAIYRAEGPDGSKWRVSVTFVSDTGYATSNVAEAIWHWLKFPNSEWNSVQRITPWQLNNTTRKTYETAVIAALDLPTSNTQ